MSENQDALLARVQAMPVRAYGGPLGRGVMLSGEDRDALCAALTTSEVALTEARQHASDASRQLGDAIRERNEAQRARDAELEIRERLVDHLKDVLLAHEAVLEQNARYRQRLQKIAAIGLPELSPSKAVVHTCMIGVQIAEEALAELEC